MSAKTGGGHQPLVPKILHTRVTRDYLAAYVSKLRRASFQISCRRPRVFATAAMWSSDADCDASQHLFNPTKRDGAALWQTFTSVSTWRARAHNVTDRGERESQGDGCGGGGQAGAGLARGRVGLDLRRRGPQAALQARSFLAGGTEQSAQQSWAVPAR